MVTAILARLARVRVTVGYAVVLAVVTVALVSLDPAVQDRIILHASTNLHNLRHGHLGTLLGSAFVVDAGPLSDWLPGLICLLALAELLWRSRRLIIAFAVGHVGATLVVAAGLWVAVTYGWLPRSVTRTADVGMSYGATAVLGAITPAIPRRWRPAWMGWWVAVAVTAVVVDQDFTDVGHLVALMLGMLVATWFGAPRPWTYPTAALLGLASCFGFMVFASSPGLIGAAAAAGLAGAAVTMAGAAAWTLPRSRRGPKANPSAGEPQADVRRRRGLPQAPERLDAPGTQGDCRLMGVVDAE
ncbi:rhomboid-like protein [Mycobacterium yunnanensis]|uniref:rhomboid-like protein n=1 Tax=Mycobacterium yunnanensis TaxID=368477 RepID=UPI0027E2FCE4|nr:rhomboid-like protein [Mycobacterium yunnanensis]